MTLIHKQAGTNKNQWANSYKIFFIGFGGSLYDAGGVALSDSIVNDFASESDAWGCLNNFHGLNSKLIFTVLCVRKFTG